MTITLNTNLKQAGKEGTKTIRSDFPRKILALQVNSELNRFLTVKYMGITWSNYWLQVVTL